MGRGAARSVVAAVAAGLLLLPSPTSSAAHSELVSSTVADGAIVPSPLVELIMLEFSAPLAEGSKAELFEAPFRDPETGAEMSPLLEVATVDGPAGRMTFPRTSDLGLGSGDFLIQWTSIAEDGDLLRGTIEFTVASSGPTASAAPTAEAAPSTEPASPSVEPFPSATPSSGSTSGRGDVILPIVVALLVVAAGAAYLLRRRGLPASSK